jgi:CRP-like cAMP-binding protein
VIFKEGDKSLDLFLIVKGEVYFKKSTGDNLRVMSQSNIFGERGLFEKQYRTATAYARQPDTILMRIPYQLIQREIPDYFYTWIKERDQI